MGSVGEEMYVKAMFGENARQVAFNYVLQGAGENKAILLGNTTFAKEMAFGGSLEAPHVLVMCDAIIRPHLVIESKHLVGEGVAGIVSRGIADVNQWLQNGRVVLNAIPRR